MDFFASQINNAVKKSIEGKPKVMDTTSQMVISQIEEAIKKRDDPERAKNLK